MIFESEICEGSNFFKKFPKITPRDVSSYAYMQRKILIFGSEMHLLGGTGYGVSLQYTTCTLWLWDSRGQPS